MMSTDQDEHLGAGQYYRRLLALAFVHWKIFAVSIVGMILVAGTDTALAAYMKPLMDDGFVNRDLETIRRLPLILVGIFIVRVFAIFISMYCISWVGRKVIMVLREGMFSKLLCLPKAFYDNATSGEIISKFTFDVEQVANASTKAITILVRDTFTIIGMDVLPECIVDPGVTHHRPFNCIARQFRNKEIQKTEQANSRQYG